MSKICIIWRGIPGSGKSTIDRLVRQWHDLAIREPHFVLDDPPETSVTCCTDDYWWIGRCDQCNTALCRVNVAPDHVHECKSESGLIRPWKMKLSYEFDYDRIRDAHQWNRKRFESAIGRGVSLVTLTNVSYARKFFEDYSDYASKAGYTVFTLSVDCSVEEALNRQQHNVPEEVVRRFARSWETLF